VVSVVPPAVVKAPEAKPAPAAPAAVVKKAEVKVGREVQERCRESCARAPTDEAQRQARGVAGSHAHANLCSQRRDVGGCQRGLHLFQTGWQPRRAHVCAQSMSWRTASVSVSHVRVLLGLSRCGV